MEIKTFDITEENVAKRLDVFLQNSLENITRSQIKSALDNGLISVNDKKVKAGYSLKLNDKIVFTLEEKKLPSAKPQNLEIDVVFEDDFFAIINKAQGMVVHPANGNFDGTLVNALTYRFNNLSTINGNIRPGIVHRLDKNTSGLMVVAKNDFAHQILAKQIQEKTAVRKYYALLEGVLKEDEGTINRNLKRSEKDRKKYITCEANAGRRAVSHFKVIKRFEKFTLCEFKLETGRTHQIRVHANYLKHPVVGDDVYGFKQNKFKTNGQLLHSHYLGFYHPKTNNWVEFEAELPNYFKEILAKLK